MIPRQWFFILASLSLLVVAALSLIGHDILWTLLVIGPLVVVGLYDAVISKHNVLRNYPLIGHGRYFAEFIRPNIQQYFINTNQSGRPYSRETRDLVNARAEGGEALLPFGTQHDLMVEGDDFMLHSINVKHVGEEAGRVLIGGPDCLKPYDASRLNVSSMSFGSLSARAVFAINTGAKQAGCWQDTGEGSLSLHHLEGGGDLVWQLGTGYFGCRTLEGDFDPEVFAKKSRHDQVKMISIKLSQGAKPSHGGVLPAAKITPEIARIRGIPMGQDCLSPPTHSAFATPRELLAFVAQLRELSEGKPVGFKLCVGDRSEFLGIVKAMQETGIKPDFIQVDGAEGGTGAAPLEFTNRLGTPINEGLAFVHDALVGAGLRDDIRLIASGKIATGFDMITKMALGADICVAARA
ncbi:MAG: FMN-binding glutamate synthase family protein, partial [Rhodospirillaceae bacterium]|nr:FMN-binding glutamate synthase family protein [Rhodospirillaceae bacterium]